MYPTSSTYITQATAQTRRPNVRVDAYIQSGTDFIETPITPLSVEFSDKREGFVGGFSARTITLVTEQWFDNIAYFNVYVGFAGAVEEVLLGKYYLDAEDLTYDDIKKTYKLVLYDGAIKFDVQYEPLTFPSTGLQLMTEIATRLGFTVDVVDLPLNNYTFQNINVADGDILTYRQVVSRYAQLNLATAHITPSGKLTFKNAFNQLPVATIDGEHYTDLKINKEVKPINALVYNQEAVEDPVYVRDETSIDAYGLNEFRFENNLFIDLLERTEQQSILTTLFGVLEGDNVGVGYVYYPFSTKLFIRPDLEAVDIISIKDTSDVVYHTVLENMSWTWNGGLKGAMECKILPETSTDYTLSKEEYDALVMGVKVNRVEGKIISYVNDEVEGLSSQITQTAEQIRMEVAETYVSTGSLDEYKSEVTTKLENITTEGRNYVLKSDEVVLLDSDISEHTYDLSEPYEANVDYTISVEFETTSGMQMIFIYIDGLSTKNFMLSPTTNVTSWTGKTSNGGATSVRIERLSATAQINKIWITKSNQQMGWSLAPEDVQNEITRVETTLTGNITTEANRITAEVSERTAAINTLTGEVEDVLDYSESNIEVLKNQVVLKSDTNGKLVLVKLDSSGDNGTSFTVGADNIDLSGYVTVSSLSGYGTTTIDGSNIKTGTISANRINFNGAVGTNVNLSGEITATSGKVGGFNISSGNLVGTSVSLKPNEITIGDASLTSESVYGHVLLKGWGFAIGTGKNDGFGSWISLERNLNQQTVLNYGTNGISVYGDGLFPATVGTNSEIGWDNRRWGNIYLVNQPNVSSDNRYKLNVDEIDPLLIEIFGTEVKPKSYNTVHDNKQHFGYIAQDVEKALYKYLFIKYSEETDKLNASRLAKRDINKFALLFKDESYMSLLYGEVNVIIEAYHRMKNEKLENRISLLEKRGL